MSNLVLLVDAVSCAMRAIQPGSCLLELLGMWLHDRPGGDWYAFVQPKLAY